jgi:hypothetical protein
MWQKLGKVYAVLVENSEQPVGGHNERKYRTREEKKEDSTYLRKSSTSIFDARDSAKPLSMSI